MPSCSYNTHSYVSTWKQITQALKARKLLNAIEYRSRQNPLVFTLYWFCLSTIDLYWIQEQTESFSIHALTLSVLWVLCAIEYRSRQNPFYIQLWNCVIFRLLLAVLIKHHDLAHVILGLVEHGQGDAGKIVLPKSIVELLRVVGQVKRSLIKVSHLPS